MADPNLRDFYGRVAQIEKSHRRGHGFEATGAVGRSGYRNRRGLRLPVMGPVLVLVCGVIGLKAAIHNGIGGGVYDQKVEALWQGDTLDQIGAVVMQADPATLYLSAWFAQLTR